MIQLIKEGPKIPEELEQALRNDNLVFFCGAGISVSNGLPLFKGLIKQVCKELKDVDISKEPLKSAKKREDYAGMLNLLEEKVSRETLRKEVIKILNKKIKGKPEIHKALLELSALSDNKGHRLVTTNFDKLFFEAGLKPEFSDSAPKLAPPRKERWKNLTFLHGVIDENKDTEGNNLILTKTDFGLAYLHDNWAARFIIQLFQDFTILFIGYSVNDPVMNYLVSAISYENNRRQKKNPSESGKKNQIKPSIYAFVGYEKDKNKENEENKWKSIGIEPISYKIKNKKNHSLLYNTIKKWAESKRTGLAGRKNWLKDQLKTPYKEEADKEKAETVISFLKVDKKLAEYLPEINFSSDPKELKPKEFKPIDISWLIAFSEEKKETENALLKKLTRPTAQSPTYLIWEPLSTLETNIVKCLCYHLNDKKLIHCLIEQSPIQNGIISLHPEFKNRIKRQLKIVQKNSNKNLDERQELFWEIITNQEDKIEIQFYEGQRLINILNQKYSYEQAQELLFILEPQIGFTNYFYDKKFADFLGSDKIYETKLVIKMDGINYPSFEPLTNEICLLRHAEDWTFLLKKAMNLAEWSGLIKENEMDLVCENRACIEKNEQNKNLYSWTYLIDLVRDSFDLAILEKDKKLEKLLLSKWQNYPYSLFYRLILYAVTEYAELSENISEDIVVKLFEEKPEKTLWSNSCQYEVLKFLRKRNHSKDTVKKILPLIMKGPDRSSFKANLDENDFIELKEREIYLRLHHLQFSSVPLSGDEKKFYKEIPKKYSFTPSTRKEAERESFPFYVWEPTQIDSKKSYHYKTDEQVFEEIKSDSKFLFHETKEKMKSFFKDLPDGPKRAFQILSRFIDKDLNSAPYWMIFVFEASMMTDKNKSKEWVLKVFDKIENFSDDFLKKCLWGLIHALNMKDGLIYYKNKDFFEKWWFKLWDLSITKPYETTFDISFEALNSNLGKLSESIIQILWRKFPYGKIKKNAGIPEDIKKYFESILKGKKDPSSLFHFGSYLSRLWYLDREWTIENLKPLMSWEDKLKDSSNKNDLSKILTQTSPLAEDAIRALWQGYLFHNMFLGPDFLEDFKEEFFGLLLNYKKILTDKYPIDYVANIAGIFFITTGGKNIENIFSDQQSNKLIQSLEVDVLESLSRQIGTLLKDTGLDKSAILWSEKIKPWIEKFWPKQKNKRSPKISENLSFIMLYCGDKLSDAFNTLKDKIEEVEKNSDYLAYHILEDNENKKKSDIQDLEHIYKYPKELLQILIWNFSEPKISVYKYDENIKKILNKLKEKHPGIEQNEDCGHLYKKLLDKIN